MRAWVGITVAATLLASASFVGLVVQLGGVRLGPGAGGAAVAGVAREQVERTAQLAREVAVARPAATAAPEPTASLAARLAALRRQLDYCAGEGSTRVVDTVRPGAFDAVFGLGAGVLADPAERPTVLAGDENRMRAAGAYFAASTFGAASVLGFSGGRTAGPQRPSEAAAMQAFVQSSAFQAAYGRTAGAPVTSYDLEERATTTAENVDGIADLAAQRGWRRVLVVTSYYHVPRTGLLAEKRQLAAEVVAAEALVDGALRDPTIHQAICAWYASPAMAGTIEREVVALADVRARA